MVWRICPSTAGDELYQQAQLYNLLLGWESAGARDRVTCQDLVAHAAMKLGTIIFFKKVVGKHWEAFYRKELGRLGFAPGKTSTCAFRRPEREIPRAAHGDDFTFAGTDE